MRSPADEPFRRERFDAQVLVHLGAAYNLAHWLLRDGSAAEDAVQDACLRAYRFFDGLQGPSPKAWFMAIVRRACFDAMARGRRRGAEESFDEAEHGQALRESTDAHTPESLAMRSNDHRLLHECLATLKQEYREVLVLRELEDLSYREISEVVGVPIGTVMSRLSRGREQLAQRLRSGGMRRSS